MATRADWDAHFGSGIRSAYEFTIYTATFGTDLAYNNGQTYLLILTGVDEENQPSTEMLSLGTDWTSDDGGFTAVHPKKAAIDQNSVYGKWCHFAGDAVLGIWEDFWGENPLEAAIWNDTKWKLEEREVGNAFTDRKTGKEVAARTRLVPVAFLGKVSDAPVVQMAPTAVVDPAALLAQAQAQAMAAANGNGTTLSPVELRLVELAKANDFQTFINLALSDPEVVNDDQLGQRVIDQGPSGFYTLYH